MNEWEIPIGNFMDIVSVQMYQEGKFSSATKFGVTKRETTVKDCDSYFSVTKWGRVKRGFSGEISDV